MDKTNTGGPAFPCEQGTTPDGTWNQTFEQGMTLRDYFAAKALSGAFTSPIESTDGGRDYIAMQCYKMADAMLKARAA